MKLHYGMRELSLEELPLVAELPTYKDGQTKRRERRAKRR